jgi:hypothetical protein
MGISATANRRKFYATLVLGWIVQVPNMSGPMNFAMKESIAIH